MNRHQRSANNKMIQKIPDPTFAKTSPCGQRQGFAAAALLSGPIFATVSSTTSKSSSPSPSPSTASVTLATQLSPHSNPLGQQPPPSSAPHVIQPLAQSPVANASAASTPSEASIVTPLVATIVLEGGGGQEVELQSRSIRQQPP